MSVSQAITKNDLINVLEEVVNLDGTDLSQEEINNFVEDLYVTGIQAADYVIEQGQEGIWTYRKWNSGISECWGTHSWTITAWAQWGSIYESSSSYASYPSSLFVSAPTFSVNNLPLSNSEATLSVEMNQTLASETRTPTMYLTRGSNGTANVTGYVSIHARGTWK